MIQIHSIQFNRNVAEPEPVIQQPAPVVKAAPASAPAPVKKAAPEPVPEPEPEKEVEPEPEPVVVVEEKKVEPVVEEVKQESEEEEDDDEALVVPEESAKMVESAPPQESPPSPQQISPQVSQADSAPSVPPANMDGTMSETTLKSEIIEEDNLLRYDPEIYISGKLSSDWKTRNVFGKYEVSNQLVNHCTN